MAGHTDGPWHISGTDEYLHIGSHQYMTVHCSMNPRHPDVVANARLIAAAPSMLEALKQAKEYHDRDAGRNGLTAEYELLRLDIDAAIARAEATK